MLYSEISKTTISLVYLVASILSIVIVESHASEIPYDLGQSSSIRCNLRIIDNDPTRSVCVCNETSCDNDLTFEWPKQRGDVKIITTSQFGQRFEISDNQNFDDEEIENDISSTITRVKLYIDLSKKHQSILGWGGAFTDATCYHIRNVSSQLGEKLISSYYGSGLRYNFGRVPIGGTDFSARAYSYDDGENNEPDYDLINWSLAPEDEAFKIPVIKRALELIKDNNLKLFASPWSPPSWMKTNKAFARGHLIDTDQVYSSYAKYLIKFFDSYHENGIDFWGATLQNEPASAYLPIYWFNSLQFGADEQKKFITKYYGPALRATNRTKENFKLIIGDDSLGFLNLVVPGIMSDPETAQYVSGLGFHFYTSGLAVPYSMLNDVYEQVKSKIEFVMMTEGCMGSSWPSFGGPRLGDWTRGEAYASDIIEDLWRHTNAWIDWNMVLDPQGGPNWSKNWVDSPIIVDQSKKEFYKQPMYYALAHFSTLFPENCRVILPETLNGNAPRYFSYVACHIEATGHLVLNTLNQSNERRALSLAINKQQINTMIESRSITSIVIKL